MHGGKWVGETAGVVAVIGNCAGGQESAVSREFLAQVFEDEPPPFETNPDGSVDMAVYLAWLNEAGRMALQAFDECFEIEGERFGEAAARLA